ncbi:hypothetical protein C2G38_2183937 [Gigaspora rosea]|uniref:Uncharacterized protein n=1 Tax=Gigaspora rosea TaxID=44941 RepID=A0A397VCJ7_9GLOM|nr:hypothetical protein C2G38_2183937 [Gigaspora rosea]
MRQSNSEKKNTKLDEMKKEAVLQIKTTELDDTRNEEKNTKLDDTNDERENHVAKNAEWETPGTKRETLNRTAPTTNEAHTLKWTNIIIHLELQMYNYYSREIGVRASLLSTNSLLDWSKTSRGVFVIVGGSIFGGFGNASECLEALDGIQYSLWSVFIIS